MRLGTPGKKESIDVRKAMQVLVIAAGAGGLSFLSTGCESSQKSSDTQPSAEHPNGENPNAEHPKGEQSQSEHPEGEHPK